MKAFKDEMQEFKVEMQAFRAEAERDRKRMNKAWGDLANKLGTIVEDIVAPNIPRLAREDFGLAEIDAFYIRPVRRDPVTNTMTYEYDIVCAGSGRVIIVEVKSSPTVHHIDKLPERLADFRAFFPEFSTSEVIGVLASWSIDPNLCSTLSQRGFYGLAMNDDTMEIVARPLVAGVN
jgi:hypothetical protein